MKRMCYRTQFTALAIALVFCACNQDAPAPVQPGARDAQPVGDVDGDGAQRDAVPDTAASDQTRDRPAAMDDMALAAVSLDARFDGFGPLRLGMTMREAEAAWPELFAATPGLAQRSGCFHANVANVPYFALMFDGGRLVRYGGSPDDVAAPGGGKRGMRESELQALYRNALQPSPDRFAQGGKLLSLQPSGVAPSKLVFVLRPDGVVNEWRVGLLPQADYDEGCEGAG